MRTPISKCRVCGNKRLTCVLDLGEQMLTGVFPKNKQDKVTTGPLRLVRCTGNESVCGLLQLEHSYDLNEMYGLNYGYRSGLNPSMVAHLRSKVERILQTVKLQHGDLVIDIGSNDGTALSAYPKHCGAELVGIDPTGVKFHSYYPEHVKLISDFFNKDLVSKHFSGKKAKVITAFAMFYDLERPVDFMREVGDVLDDDGVWVFEQSYMPTMLAMNAYDTVCHEHLEYYGLRQIKWMADRAGLHIVDVEMNDVNGGSFSVTVRKSKHDDEKVPPHVQAILDSEHVAGMHTSLPYKKFAERVLAAKHELVSFVHQMRSEGKMIAALGASTKGNVMLQYCHLTAEELSCIGEVNREKFGCYTPNTWIPIIPEDALLAMHPDYVIVLPWHFKSFFQNTAKFKNYNLVFPLPHLHVIEKIRNTTVRVEMMTDSLGVSR